MDEQQLLSRLRRGDEQALAAVIARFSAYVVTVIHNRSRGLLSPEDEDELASSTFFALWQSCRTVKAGSIRAWLGSVARNKTVDRLRRARMDMPLDEEGWPGQTIFFSRRLSKRNRRGSCARRSRCCQRSTARSSGGFTTCARPRRKSPPCWG